MSKRPVSTRLQVAKTVCAVMLSVLLLCAAALGQQASPNPPRIWLSEPQGLTVNHVSALSGAMRTAPSRAMSVDGDPGVAPPVAVNLGQSVSMASADFDEDGIADLAVGYKGPQGFSIVIHRGNLDAFAPQSDASFQAIGRGEFPSPFLTDAQVIGIPISPDFIATGNFTGNGHTDVVFASRGGSTMYVLPGDGQGNFGIPEIVNLQGSITSLAAGDFGSPRQPTLLVSVSGQSNNPFALMVFRDGQQGLTLLSSLRLSAPASNILFGEFGDPGPDAVFLSGGRVSILRSSSWQVEAVGIPVVARTMAIGTFIYDRNPDVQIALLSDDGSVQIAAHNEFNPRPYSADEMQGIRQAGLRGHDNPLLPRHSFPANGWKIVESFPSIGTVAAGQSPVFFRTQITGNGADDLMWLNASSGQMAVISHPNLPVGATTFAPGQVSVRPYGAAPVNALPVRINIDARPGIIALHQGEITPSVMMPLPDPTFFVNRFDDPVPNAQSGVNTCTNASNVDTTVSCSLREATLKANATGGPDTIQLIAGTYTLSQPRVAGDFTGQHGTLEITDTVTITGAVDGSGNPASIIQAGTTNANGVDKIMSINEDITVSTTASASLSNLVLRFGRNLGNALTIQDGFGGAFDFDIDNSNATLSLTNCTITDNQTTDGEGGGFEVFNTGGNAATTGFAQITNSTVQNNKTRRNPANGDPNGAGNGGGITIAFPARFVMTNTKVLNNDATQVQGSGIGIGGGLFLIGGSNFANPTTIHGGQISGNQAAGDGGGIWNTSGLTIDQGVQGTVISNNTAGTSGQGSGGGIWFNAATPRTGSISKAAITGNAANASTGFGGGLEISNGAGLNFSMSFSRLAGNTAHTGSNLDWQSATGASVTATNNWWGTDVPGATIAKTGAGTLTFDPFIVLTHSASPSKIRINTSPGITSTTLTGDMSKDNHGNAVGLANLDRILGLPITFDNAVLGTIPQAQPETLNASAQATATFNAGNTSGRGSANATVDQAVIGANSNFIASATEAGTTVTITTVGIHNFATNETVVISGVGVGGYNGTFTITSTPTPTTFTYTATAGLGASSGGTAKVGIIILEPPQITKSFGAATIPINGTTTVSFSINNPNVVAINASFTDTLPAGLQVAATPGVTNSCGGTVTAVAGSGSISFSNNLTPIGVCTITVNITGTADNNYTNSVQILSSDAGNGNTSSANITVINPPHIVKAFSATTIPLNGTTSLTFTIDPNGNQNLTLTGVSFTDSLPTAAPGTLVVATPGNPSTTCTNGTVTAADGSPTVTLTGASVPPGNASSCTVTVTVKGTVAGLAPNSVQVTSSNGGNGNTSSASVTVVAPPTISKAFGAASIPLNGTTSLTFTVTNPNTATTLNGIAFSDTVPANLKMIGFGSAGDTCNGTTSPGSSTVNYSAITLAANSSCTLTVTVKGIASGDAVNTTSTITSTEGGTGTTSNTATLTVVAPPTISKAFGAATIPLNGTTTVTFTIANPGSNTTAENGIAFSDTLTNGLQVGSTPGVSNTCGGTVTAVANSTSISLSGGSIATPGNTCTISVNVAGTQAGTVTNTTGAVNSTNGGTGAASNTATLTVVAPPIISKAFGAAAIPLNGTTTVTFTITNPATNTVAENGIAFSDTLTNGLQVASTPGVSSDCGGTATATANSTSISLSGGSIATPGNTCTVVVNVTGTQAGTVPNTTGAVSSTNGGTGTTSNTATLTVVAPPTISKAFGAASVPLNGTTSLTFTITNPNAATALTGIAFSDTVPANLKMIGFGSAGDTCNGTTSPGSSTVNYSAIPLAANSSCTLTVTVKGIAAGDALNTTSTITSTEGGTGTTSNTATLKVVAPPIISKAFGAANITLNGTTTVTFTITNPASNTSAENGIAFSDTLTNGLQVASTPGVSNTCGGTVTAAANSTSISLTGGSIATPGSTCTIVVNVTGTQSGTVSNTTGAVSSTNGGTGATSNTATLIVASPATVTKGFGATRIPQNGTTSLTINITNPNTNVSLTGLSFTDSLPAGLVVATPNGLTNTCGGTATATAGSGSVSLSGGTVAASTSCSVSVNVQGTTAGDKNNSVTVSSTEGGASTPATATVTVVAPATISKAFGAGSVPLNGTTTVTFTISNPNNPATPANGDLTGLSFNDTLPVSGGAGSATLVVSSTPNVTNTCGGTVTATAGSGAISLTGGSVAHNASCTISVDVKGTVEGDASNTTGAINSTEGGTGTTSNTATMKVVAPPTINKAFGAANVSLNGTTTVTFTITNPASNTSAENGVAFSDTLTNGLQVASTPGVSNTCGGTVTAAANSTSISLTGGSIATPGATCTIVVNVTGTQSGTVTNTTGAVSSTNGGTGATSNTATLIVASPPSITKFFLPSSVIPLNGSALMVLTIQNPNTNVTLTGVAFTDNMPAGMIVSTPNNLNSDCGGTVTAVAGSGSVSLTGGIIAPSASCSVSVSITGTTVGAKTNSVQVTSTEGGTGNTANAPFTVVGPPVIIKAFGAASIPLNGSTSLSFTIQNNNTTTALTGVAFSDTLPAGLVISTPNGLTGSCGSGTITATQGTNVISLTGGTIAASSSCTFAVNVTGTAAGTQTNTTGNVTSTEGGTGGTASASLNVEAPPSIQKVFNPSTISLNATTSLTFTITNPAANVQSLTGVAFTDTLPTGLTVANASATVCGGTLTTTAPTGIALTGATIAANSTCQFSVTVTGAASGQYTNTTGNVTSTNGGTGNTASASLTVASPATVTKLFGAAMIPLNGTTSLTINITNPNSNVSLTGLSFTDSLPAGLVVASTPNLSNTCGGTATATGGSGSVTLSGGTLAASASCAVSVDVQGTTAGVKNNSVVVSSTEGGASAAANASVTVVGPPVIIKAFGAASIPLNGSTSLSFTIQNNNTTTALTGVAFSDTLPAGLVISTPNGLTGSCGSGTITATQGTNVISLTGGTIAASNSCTFAVNVTGTAAGTQTNTTGNVTSTEGGTGGTATASVNVEAPPSIQKVFNPSTIALNATTSLTFTITNPTANVDPLTGVAFTDTLPTGLTVANASATVCGGTLTTTAPTGIALSGATINTNSQCQFSVTVTGAASGQYTNTTGSVSSSNGGTGNTASASLTVASVPTITKAFGAASILLNASTSLTFNISNPNTTLGLTGVSFSDALPAGLAVATPNALNSTCGGTVTATAGSGSVSLSSGALAANGSCAILINVKGTQAGVQNNTTGPISSNESGAGATSNTASITVIGPPTIAKAFGAASINLNAQTTLSFTITNPNATVALTGVAFGDTLPGGLTVATPNGLTGSCGAGTITTGTVSGFSVINLSGGTIAAGGSCTFSVNVVGTTGGHKVNTTGTVTSSNAGSGNQATASIDVLAPDPTITKTHPGDFQRGGTGTYTITVSNVGFGPTVGTVTVTDTLPAVPNTFVPTAMSGTGWTCNLGTLTCTRSDGLPSGSSYPPITLTVNVPINIQANVTNTATVSGGGDVNPNNNTATDPTHIGPPLQIVPTNASDMSITAGSSGTMAFTVDSSAGLGFVTFGCSGLPTGASCSFNPQSENQLTTQITMTVTSMGRNGSASTLPFGLDGTTPRIYAAMLFPLLGLLGITLSGKNRKKAKLRLAVCLVGLLVLLAFAGCGGTAVNPLATPQGSFPVTVTAASSTVQASTTVVVNVK